MKFLNFKSIKTKFALLISFGFLLSIAITATYAFFAFRNKAKENALHTIQLYTDNYTAKIKAKTENGINIIKAVSDFMSVDSNTKLFSERQKTVEYLKNILKKNYDFTNIFMIWEPIAFDKKDSLLKNIEYSDTTGRFIPYLLKSAEDEIVSKQFDDFSDFINTELYKKAGRELHTVISEPSFIRYKGTDKLIVTILSPIIAGNRFYGIVGTNMLTENLNILDKKSNLFIEETETLLLSETGKIINYSGKFWLTGKNIEEYQGIEHEMYTDIKRFGMLSTSEKYAGTEASFKLSDSDTYWQVFVFIPYEKIISSTTKRAGMVVLIASILMVISLFVIIYFFNKTLTPLNDIINLADRFKKGEIVEIKESDRIDEIGRLNNAFKTIAENLKETASVGVAIASGNYNKKVKQKSEKDILAFSVNQISDNLKKIEEVNLIQKQEAEKQLWIRNGRFEIANAQRKSSGDVNNLSLNLIQSIVNYVDAVLGGVYIYRDEDMRNPYIELVAAYAYGSKKHLEKIIKPGEGLIGTCALEGKKIILTNIPENYIEIAAGMGSMPPKILLIFPIFYDEKLIALIEIAFLKKIEDYKITLIEQLTENIGSWIAAAKISAQTSRLLKKSREHELELSKKEAQLEKNLDELKKIQKQSAVNTADMKAVLNAINHTIMSVEYTTDGTVLNANDIYLRTMELEIEQIKGINVLELVKDQREELEEIISQVKKGQYIERFAKRTTGTGEVKWLYATYTPYYDINGLITKILFFAFDMTTMKENQEQLSKAKELLEENQKKIKEANIKFEEKFRKYRKLIEKLDFELEAKNAENNIIRKKLNKFQKS